MSNPSMNLLPLNIVNGGSNVYPLFPPINFNPSQCTIELIMTLVLVNVGMGPLDQSMKQIVQEQQLQNKVDADLIQYSELVSEIESAATEKGADPAQLQKLQQQLQQFVKNTFGQNATVDKNGNIVPDPNSDLGKFMQMLKDEGQDPTQNPVFQLINKVGVFLKTGDVTGSWENSDGTWSLAIPTGNVWDNIFGSAANFQNMMNALSGNYWLAQNPGTKDNNGLPVTPQENYLSEMYNDASGAQSGLQGLGSQNTAMIQTLSASENSLDQTGQNILNLANSLKTFFLQQIQQS